MNLDQSFFVQSLRFSGSKPHVPKKGIHLILVFIKMKVKPEKRKELSQTLHSIVEKMRKESGCVHAGLYQDVENENDVFVIEEWETQEDSDNHLRSDIFTVLIGAKSLLRRPPEIMIHAVSHSSELET
jgi:quinol monooxygenase YgiN